MKKSIRILALIGALLLVALYVSTLVLAILDHSQTKSFFYASIYATVIVPVLIWAYKLIYGLVTRRRNPEEEKNKS